MIDQPSSPESQLPPRPDPATGQPRPPRASVHTIGDQPKQHHGRENDPAKAPAAPAGEGPVLEWYQSSRRDAVLMAVGSVPLFCIAVTVLQGFSLQWMHYWQLWLVVPVLMLLLYITQRGTSCAAGAEWVKTGKMWVRLYELTEIKVKHRSNALHLDLTDQAGRSLQIQLDHLQYDRDLWDLVYNGLLHSTVAGRAHTNTGAHGALELPQVPR